MSESTLTFAKMAAIAPELNDLLAEARAVRDPGNPSYCRDSHLFKWPNGAKYRLDKLVGYDARNADERLRNDEAWHTAFHEIMEALPPCRNCPQWC